jgi:hypothetical protein
VVHACSPTTTWEVEIGNIAFGDQTEQ